MSLRTHHRLVYNSDADTEELADAIKHEAARIMQQIRTDANHRDGDAKVAYLTYMLGVLQQLRAHIEATTDDTMTSGTAINVLETLIQRYEHAARDAGNLHHVLQELVALHEDGNDTEIHNTLAAYGGDIDVDRRPKPNDCGSCAT